MKLLRATIATFALFCTTTSPIEGKSFTESRSERVKRQISQSSASASASSSSAGGRITNENGYGLNRAIALGGVGSHSSVGNLKGGTRTGSTYQPLGGFPGHTTPNQGFGGGCVGVNCGFQLSDFLAQFPFFNQGYTNNGYGYASDNDYNNDYDRYSNNRDYFNSPQYQQQYFPSQNTPINADTSSVSNFARIGGRQNPGNLNVGQSSTFTSSNVNGVQQTSGTEVDENGRVTSYQSDGPGTIQTRIAPAPPGQRNGVYSTSSINIASDGKVTSYRDSGHF